MKFLSRGPAGALLFTPSEIIFAPANMRMRFAGAHASPEISGVELLPGRSNYFVGSNSADWKTDIPQYAKVQYKQLYDGIDLVFYGNQNALEYDVIVAPGADPGMVQMEFVEDRAGERVSGRAGESRLRISDFGLRIDENGDLVVRTSAGEIRQLKPKIYQEINGVKFPVPGRYVINSAISRQSAGGSRQSADGSQRSEQVSRSAGQQVSRSAGQQVSRSGGQQVSKSAGQPVDRSVAGNPHSAIRNPQSGHSTFEEIRNPQSAIRNWAVTFQIDSYDKSKPLVIDPKVVTPVNIPGSGNQQIFGIAADAQGNWYLTGKTDSTDFATRNPIQSARAGDFDAFVMKLSPDGKTIIYSTYLGGTKPDSGFGIAVDSSVSAYVAGMTDSSNFPTRNPIQSAYAGPANPTTFRGDPFVAKLSPDGSSLVYSTYLGGSQTESVGGIAVDSSGNAYVAGKTSSKDFPTRNPLQSTMTPAGTTGTFFEAGFISKLNADGSALVYSTFFGGATDIHRIAVDSAGNVYVVGDAGTIPSPNGFQRTPGEGGDAFVAKVNSAGSAVVYSTYLGGSSRDQGFAIAVDGSGSAYVSGRTDSTNFPTASPFQPAKGGGTDAFVTKLNPAGTALVYSSYLGGSGFEESTAIAVDSTGRAYVGGDTQSTNFPVKEPTQAAYGGNSDMFVTQLSATGTIEYSTYIGTAAAEFSNTIALGRPKTQKMGDNGVHDQTTTSNPPIGEGGVKEGEKALFFISEDILVPPPTEIFEEDNCIRLIKPDREINGKESKPTGKAAVADSQGRSLGYTVVPTKPPTDGKLFTKIDDAFRFSATEKETGKVIDIAAGDTVQLLPCPPFVQRVNIPTSYPNGSALSGNKLVGSGKGVTKIFNPGGTGAVITVDGDAVTVASSTVDAIDQKSGGVRFSSGNSGTISDIEIFHADPGISSSGRKKITIDQARISSAVSSAIRIEGAETGVTIRGSISDSGVTIYESQEVKVESTEILQGLGLNLSKVKNFTIGPNVRVRSSLGIYISDSSGNNTVAGSLGRNEITGNLTGGIRIYSSTVTITRNRIANNGSFGVGKDAGSRVVLNNNTFYNNGRGVSDNVVTVQKAAPSDRFGIDAPDVYENNVIVGNIDGGIELINDGNVDLGGGIAGSKGGNIIAGNGKIDLTNATGKRISAKNNIWLSSDPNEILSKYVSPGTGGVDVAPVMPVQAKYFAQFAEAPTFTSTLTLTNPSRTNPVPSLLAFRNSAGSRANVSLNGLDSPGGLQADVAAPLGAVSFSTNSGTTAVNVGSMTVASGRPLAGTVLFSGPAGVAGVGASELLTQFIAPVEKSASKSVNSGIAITNPSTTTAVTVALRLRESSTGKITEGTLQLPAGGQAAKFIDELFSGLPSEFSGTLSASAPAQVAATVIRTSPGQFATLPVTGAGSKKLLFAQFGEVTGISSTLTFVNPSLDKTASVTVKIFDDNGAPLTVNLGGQDRPGQFIFSVPPQASVSFASPGSSTAAKVGSVVVDSTENIGGTILFGGSFGLAGVGASQALSNFIAPVEQTTQGGVTVGLALMNVGTTQTTVKLTLRDESGTPVDGGTVDVVLKSQGHVAKFLGQFFDKLSLADFRGTITGEATGGQIGATVIRQSTVPLEFATLPVAEIIP